MMSFVLLFNLTLIRMYYENEYIKQLTKIKINVKVYKH